MEEGAESINFDTDFVYSGFNARNIYYEEFGAKGNGKADDFEAIKACHKYANMYGHTVNATPGAVYYIGKNDEGTSAVIQTDVNWNGCTFIFDDTELTQPLSAEQNGGAVVEQSPGWNVAVFSVESEYKPTTYYQSDMPISSLKKGVDNVGFAPGFPALVLVYNSNVRHYIRYGLNEDEGQEQNEVLLVDEYGNIDPSTPIQWEYETITKLIVQRVDDKQITISGGEYDSENEIDNRAYIEQKYNKGRSFYVYCFRNINVFRSNLIIENIKHKYTDFIPYEDGGEGAPYIGFTYIRRSNNVTVRGMDYMCPPTYYLETDSRNNMGSYEIMAGVSNNLTYENSTQSNFFQEDGSVEFQGFMATNFCKNLTFNNMFACSFDAHCGVYNATVKNSTVEHLNFIGDGQILIENVVLYADGRLHSSINLRGDYGSTWAGDITVNGLEFRYAEELDDGTHFKILNTEWYNHDFGYTVHYPQNMILNDISTVRFTYGIDSETGERWEKLDETTRNKTEIYLFSPQVNDHACDLSDPHERISYELNINPVVPSRSIVINNYKYKDNPVNIVLPTSPTFKNTEITVDGVKIQ